MLTEYNGLDTSRSCSFDKPNFNVSITRESETSLILLAYALGILCIMVGWACVLKGLLFISRLTEKKHCLGDMKNWQVNTKYHNRISQHRFDNKFHIESHASKPGPLL